MDDITRDVVVIGAGAAGLTAANDLRKAMQQLLLRCHDVRKLGLTSHRFLRVVA